MTQPTVLVLAGGASTRFWPLRDKLFMELGGQCLLERHLRMLRDLGCERFILVARPDTAERAESIGKALGVDPSTSSGQSLRVVVQAEARGMADAVLAARPALETLGDGAVYVTQAHDVVEKRLHADLLDAWSRRPAGVDGLVAAARVGADFPRGSLARAGGQDDAYERGLGRLMAAGEFRAHIYDGRWQGLKYPWHLLDAIDMLLDLWQRGVESPGDEFERREDGVFVGRDVRILAGAHVVAPALIGHGTLI